MASWNGTWKSDWSTDWVPGRKPVPIVPIRRRPMHIPMHVPPPNRPVVPVMSATPNPKPKPKPSTAPELLWEWVKVEEPEDIPEDEKEQTIRETERSLAKLSEARTDWAEEKEWRPKQRTRRGSGKSKRSSDQSKPTRLPLRDLYYSQLSCKETFQCGRSVSQLVKDLLHRKVSLHASFLTLTVFETIDKETNRTILRCIDNRRLWALKEYAKKSGNYGLMVNANLFSQSTLTQVQRFIHNSDRTDGKDVRIRKKEKIRNRNLK